MATIISGLLEGLLIGFSIIIGMILSVTFGVAYLTRKSEQSETKYDREELKKAFEIFLKKLEDEEEYEWLEPTKQIMIKLDEENLPDLSKYHISKKITIWLEQKEEEGKTGLTIGKKYIIELKK